MRSDNLYIIGHTNKEGKLFAFKLQHIWQYRMPGATFLTFEGGYPDLFGKEVGTHGLLNMPVNQLKALEHLKVLTNYKHDSTTPDKNLQIPLAFFALVLCEAERSPSFALPFPTVGTIKRHAPSMTRWLQTVESTSLTWWSTGGHFATPS